MSSEILLGVRLRSKQMSVIKLSDVNLTESKIQEIRSRTAEQTNLPNDGFDLIYRGCILEDDKTLEKYGVKCGAMIHVLQRQEDEEKTMDSSDPENIDKTVESVIALFDSYPINPLLEAAFRRVAKKSDIIENIIASCPGISEDAVAVAFLQDPELITNFSDPETIKKIGKLHPALLQAVRPLTQAVFEEVVHNNANNSGAGPSSSNGNLLANMPAMFHVDNLSDDDDMMGDSSNTASPHPDSRRSRNYPLANPALAAQLAAAISRSMNRSNSNRANGASSSANQRNSGGPITFEMFDQAMQQAFASTPTVRSESMTPANNSGANTPNFQTQISLMHGMGLLNDAANFQALQITNGDVQAAIELVLSGFGEN